MTPKAANNFVFINRDESEKESEGFILPDVGVEKPSRGTILSIGKLVKDPDVKAGKGKKCLFHKGIGFQIEYEGIEYLVLIGDEIIAVV